LEGLAVLADERKLRQALFNLLSNAAKFTPDGGKIEVEAKREGEEIQVSVADTGMGIKPEDQRRIFGEFEQVETKIGQKQHGTGLGLALTRRLVELHGGRIWVESEGEGKGSNFTFAIPLNIEEQGK
jgi:signal transduction histidine kinase